MSPVPGSARIEQLAQAIAERVVMSVMDAIDIDAILARVDINAIVSRVDIDALIDRVDVEKLIERVDVEKIVERIDIDALVEQTEIGTIIAHSTSGVASEVLDVLRAGGVGLDDFVARWVNRLLRRSADELPTGPVTLEPARSGSGGAAGAGREEVAAGHKGGAGNG